MSKPKAQEHGKSQYHYGTAKISTQAKKPASGNGPSMGRRVMPGDAHASMKSKGC